jgi:hypothetical protein
LPQPRNFQDITENKKTAALAEEGGVRKKRKGKNIVYGLRLPGWVGDFGLKDGVRGFMMRGNF